MLGGNRQQFLMPRRRNSRAYGSSFGVSILFTARNSGLPVRSSSRASSMSGAGQLGAAVHHHDDGRRFLQRHARLAEDLRRDQFLVVGQNAAGIDHAQLAAAIRLRRRGGRA